MPGARLGSDARMAETVINDARDSPARPLAGALWMVLTGFLFVAMQALVKHVGDVVPAAQSAFLRYLLGLVFFLPVLPALLRLRLSARLHAAFAARGAIHSVGVLLWFFAMTQIPIAEVTAMNYLSPIYIAIGAALFLGETLKARRIAAIVIALLGALVILRPGFREISPGHLAMLGTALSLAISYLMAKRMSAELSAAAVVALLSVWVTLALAPVAAAVWVPVSWAQLGWLFLVAFFATAGHFTMTLAFKSAPITVTQPVTFLQLVWAAASGAIFFAEPIDPWVVAGGSIIMGSVCFITWREAMLRRGAVAGSDPSG